MLYYIVNQIIFLKLFCVGIFQLENSSQPDNSATNPWDHITTLPLENLTAKQKLQVVKKELQQQLQQHSMMVE